MRTDKDLIESLKLRFKDYSERQAVIPWYVLDEWIYEIERHEARRVT